MKRAIVGILNNPAKSINSHSAGWNMLIRDLIFKGADFLTEKDNWIDYDEFLICHGPNYKPSSYNIIGGVTDSLIKRINKLHEIQTCGKKIYTIDDFDVNDFLEKRIPTFKDKYFFNNFLKVEIQERSNLILGDSHSISAWPNDNYTIKRNDGKTLYGFLKNPKKYFNRSKYDDVILYFGNIDIRFHLARMVNPKAACLELVKRYIDFCMVNECRAVSLLPVESETRKIPKSGMYKGSPFFGSRDLRTELVEIFNLELKYWLKGNCLTWPEYWYNNIDFYESEVMESRQSVHLRPKYYKSREQVVVQGILL